MITKYRLTTWGLRLSIKKVLVIRESEKSIWIETSNGRGNQKAKNSKYESYFATFEEAKQAGIDNAKAELNKAMVKVNHYKEALEAAKKMEEQ